MGNSSSSENQRVHHPPQHQPYPYSPAPVYTGGRQGPYYPNYYGGGQNVPPQGQQYAPYNQAGPQQPQYQQQQHGAYSPYQVPAQPKTQECQRTATIRNQVNLKKPTLQLEKTGVADVYLVSFKFDASSPCRISTFVNATEDVRKGCKITTSVPPAPALSFGKGLEQPFPPPDHPSAMQHAVDLRQHSLQELMNLNGTQSSAAGSQAAAAHTFAVIIRLEALTDEGREANRSLESLGPGSELPDWVQSQTTYARIVKEEDGDLALRIIKQKIWVKGESYELQEIYGMERNPRPVVALGTPTTAEGFEDVDGNECVICMSAPRDTAALPCRHMCMCHQCAGALKTQTNKCPICRNEIEKLLHIKINKAPEAGSSAQAAPASVAARA